MDGNCDTVQLSEEERIRLREFRTRVEDVSSGVGDYYLYRFLKARNFSINKAEHMIREHFKCRQDTKADTILKDFTYPLVAQKYFPHYYLGNDKEGNGVFSCCVGRTDIRGILNSVTHLEILKGILFTIELLLQKMKEFSKQSGKKGTKFVGICDLEGLTLRMLLDKSVGRLIILLIMTFEANYPEMLKCIHIINVPSFFHSWFSLTKRITNSESLNKVEMYSRDSPWKEELRKIIDPDILPAIFGGNLTDPDGNEACLSMFVAGGKVPQCWFTKTKNECFKTEPGVKEVTVPEKAYFNQEVLVAESDSVLRWKFETTDYNINFGVYHIPHDVASVPQIGAFSRFSRSRKSMRERCTAVVPVARVESQFYIEEGQYACIKPGIYLLHFDNTFSWITPKKLYYKFELQPPNEEIQRKPDIETSI